MASRHRPIPISRVRTFFRPRPHTDRYGSSVMAADLSLSSIARQAAGHRSTEPGIPVPTRRIRGTHPMLTPLTPAANVHVAHIERAGHPRSAEPTPEPCTDAPTHTAHLEGPSRSTPQRGHGHRLTVTPATPFARRSVGVGTWSPCPGTSPPACGSCRTTRATICSVCGCSMAGSSSRWASPTPSQRTSPTRRGPRAPAPWSDRAGHGTSPGVASDDVRLSWTEVEK